MPIFDIFDVKEAPMTAEAVPEEAPEEIKIPQKDRFFSSLTARLLFFVLLIGDVLWWAYAFFMFALCLSVSVVTFFRLGSFQKMVRKQWISLKRSSVCAIALLVALFSPALGIMVACTYFLMYDKTGIQEVVPTSLQDQFQEFIK